MLSMKRQKLAPVLVGIAIALGAAFPVLADDTEIYVVPPSNATARPNILFMLDTSGSMGEIDDGETKSRIELLKEALNATLNGANKDINVAIAEYYDTTVRPVSAPFRRLQDHRATLVGAVNALEYGGSTPTTDALSAGVQWFEKGLGGYDSPIEYSCQANQIVLMTDGRPNTSELTEYNGESCNNLGDDEYDYIPDDRKEHIRCSFEIVQHGLTDLFPEDSDDPKTSGDQRVTTSTVAFNLDDAWAQTLMNNLAIAGGGTYYPATDADDLVDAFTDAISQLPENVGLSFTPPAVPVNSNNRLVAGNDAYFGMFQPSTTDYWPGNFKKYGLEVRDNILTLVDARTPALPAIQNGKFREDAQSFWNSTIDGDDVTEGGAAARLGTNRNTYTYLSNPKNGIASKDLTAAVNSLDSSNTAITDKMLGLKGSRKDNLGILLDWIHGLDVKNLRKQNTDSYVGPRAEMGANIHTSPSLVQYDGGPTVAFITTTEGYLHAFNTATGDELFAWMPEELLGNIERLYDNKATPADGSIPYGLDGPMTLWHNDINKDGKVNGTDHVYLYFGMRRGGNSYFALDVTSVSAPKFLWKLTGDKKSKKDKDKKDKDKKDKGAFTDLGQTWSKLQLTKVKTSAAKPVDALVFGGGYDTRQDTAGTARSNDQTGNAIYIINATTGALLWRADETSNANLRIPTMLNSIPADVRALDLNQNGVLDRIYAADTGGRVFRIDINDTVNITSNGATTGGAIADINDGTVAGNRRFYNAPDVVLVTKGAPPYLAIAIGSGHRASPTNKEVTDRLYVFKDSPVFTAPGTYTAATESDMTDTSTGSPPAGSARGWYITLSNSGEKVLANVTTLDHRLFFTSFTTGTTSSTDPCATNSAGGQGRLYAVDIRTASSVLNFDESNDSDTGQVLAVSDRAKGLTSSGIPGQIVGINNRATAPAEPGLVTDIWSGLQEEAEIRTPATSTLWLKLE